MTISANTLELLMDAGIDGDELRAIVRSIEADIAPKAKSSAAARQARYRESQKAKAVTSDVTRDVTETSQVTPLAGVDAKPKTTQIDPVKKTPSRDVADFKAAFVDLDADRLEALIKHRRAKKAQMTGHAARLFLKDAAACGISVAEAVDTCISRNWITVKAEWLTSGSGARGSPPQSGNAAAILLRQRQQNRNQTDDEQSPNGPRLIAAR